jgi:GNAT superfamily N-acetyltransferase
MLVGADLPSSSVALDCLIVETDEGILGVAVYVPMDQYGFGYVSSIAVRRGWHDKGIGERLKRQVMDECTNAGCTKVRSEVHRQNLRMQRVNHKVGIAPAPGVGDGKYLAYGVELVPRPASQTDAALLMTDDWA